MHVEARVGEIVAVSRSRNASLGVTGALFHSGARFAQRIEGPPAAIEDLRLSILADPRHDSITVLEHGPCAARLFADWSLAYSGQSRFFAGILEAVAIDGAAPDQTAVDAVALLLREFARPGPIG